MCHCNLFAATPLVGVYYSEISKITLLFFFDVPSLQTICIKVAPNKIQHVCYVDEFKFNFLFILTQHSYTQKEPLKKYAIRPGAGGQTKIVRRST